MVGLGSTAKPGPSGCTKPSSGSGPSAGAGASAGSKASDRPGPGAGVGAVAINDNIGVKAGVKVITTGLGDRMLAGELKLDELEGSADVRSNNIRL